MSNIEMSEDFIFSLFQSKEEFPVDFDNVWVWLGFSRKDSAKRGFLDAGFFEGQDFRFSHNKVEKSEKGRPSEKLMLTIDCFKMFCMMAGTDQGWQVRLYFLDCERRLKELTKSQIQKNNEIDEALQVVFKQSVATFSIKELNGFLQQASVYQRMLHKLLTADKLIGQGLDSDCYVQCISDLANNIGWAKLAARDLTRVA
jgi:phage anti-repressor protein